MEDILYTIIPANKIFEEEDTPKIEYRDIIYQGVQMQVEHLSLNKFKIIRLYSTNPADYLLDNLQPGRIISI